MYKISLGVVRAICAALVLVVAQPAQAERIKGKSGFICKTKADANGRNGWFPKDVGFYLNGGKPTALVIDPQSLHRERSAVVAKRKTMANGMQQLNWRVYFATNWVPKVSGTVRVRFDPKSLTGTIKTNVPADLTNGGRRQGTLSCKPTTFEFLPDGF